MLEKMLFGLAMVVGTQASAQTYLSHKNPPEAILVPSSGKPPREGELLKAKQECFDHLIGAAIEKKSGKEQAAQIVLSNILRQHNVKSSRVRVDWPVAGYTSKTFLLHNLEGLSASNMTYNVVAYVRYELKEYVDKLAGNTFHEMKCWVERPKIVNHQRLPARTIDLEIVDGSRESGEGSVTFYDFKGKIQTAWYQSTSSSNFFVTDVKNKGLDNSLIAGSVRSCYIQIPKSIWIDNSFENRYVSAPCDASWIWADMRDVGERYKQPPVLSETGYDGAEFQYRFYF